MKPLTNLQRKLPLIIGGAVSIVIIAGVVFFINNMLDAPPAKPKKMTQNITFVTPPPPPPPEEKPPEPEIKEEVEINEPEPEPVDVPDAPADDAPPAGDLGLDADGQAGSDAFGLLARKGGRDLFLGDGGKAGKRQYALAVKSDVQDFLSNNDALRKGNYEISIKFWYDETGKITNYELLKSTGDKQLDETMKSTLARYEKLPSAPPGGVANTITLQIISRT